MKKAYLPIPTFIAGICLLAFGGPALATKTDADFNRSIIKPSLVKLEPGQQQQFKVVKLATYLMAASAPEKVKWSVNNISGGSKKLGLIDPNGLYTAPKKAPKPHEIHICAEVEDSANRYLFATVLMGRPDPAYELVHTWSEPVDDPNYLKNPHGICLDKDGNLLIAEHDDSRILRFTPEGRFLGEVGKGKGSDPGQLSRPRVVQTDAEGNIWVSDSKGDRPRIQMFTHEGEFVRIFAEKGIGPGQIHRAHGMGFDKQQRLFVTDVDNFRVNVYSHSGQFLYSWGKPGLHAGQFNAPHGLVVDPSGDVFVSGYYGPTQKFDPNGNFLFAFAHGDPPDGPVYFHTMVGDKWGNVYLMVRNKEGGQGEIQRRTTGRLISIMKFNNNGDFVTAWSLSEPDHRESWAVVADDGTVYSLFEGEKRVGVQTFVPQ
ncbi:MAG TPA: NHL repeat-containing protein [Sedimentisphaerales bacterium]|nr:NHL repeat-containing protein [Sedimentisphaerales bacterium]